MKGKKPSKSNILISLIIQTIELYDELLEIDITALFLLPNAYVVWHILLCPGCTHVLMIKNKIKFN